MPLHSDLNIDAVKFDPSKASAKTGEFNEKLIEIAKGGPRWYEVCLN
jgi:hypothetical protein